METDLNIHNYPDLDFSEVIACEQNPVIACYSKEEAIILLAYMKREYPDFCKSWTFPEVYFNPERDAVGYNVDFRNKGFYWAELSYYEERVQDDEPDEDEDYFTIPFEHLLPTIECEESDKPIDFLFGIGG